MITFRSRSYVNLEAVTERPDGSIEVLSRGVSYEVSGAKPLRPEPQHRDCNDPQGVCGLTKLTAPQLRVLNLMLDLGGLDRMGIKLYRLRPDLLDRVEDAGLIVWRHRGRPPGYRLTPEGRRIARAFDKNPNRKRSP